jgi:DNA invertase Pin-like site-specific DNA recombinase
VLGAVGEFERDLLSERTRDGLRAARARGRTGGRKCKLKPAHVRLARQMRDELDDDGRRRHTVQDIADELDVSRGTIYRALKSPAPQPR